ncbi:glycoside hydrolase domain-containing protein [Photobacterium toruni]|uniref:Glycosyl hydrolase family 92 n=1 Tax=Photobacterium toruni TaxID=1935446 RepID=A0A1T4US71_9GAMM|nr:glycoside hydrolase domain-containing protein [Photobacterium toruni]SKA55488.1 Glycosyl hydrolase family 92 [Photobacterium toruni]
MLLGEFYSLYDATLFLTAEHVSELFLYAAEPVYTVGCPLFDEVRLPVNNGFFIVKVLNNADDNMYIKSVSINGYLLDSGLFFNHSEFKAGGELKFVMTGDKLQAMTLLTN